MTATLFSQPGTPFFVTLPGRKPVKCGTADAARQYARDNGCTHWVPLDGTTRQPIGAPRAL